MISKLSNHLVDRLERSETIPTDELEVYSYGFFILISHIVYFIICLIFGLLFKCVVESLVFLTLFHSIRKYAGGYHAKTEVRCEIISTLSIVFCIIMIRLALLYDFRMAIIISVIISDTVILMLCPLDSPEKPLTNEETRHYRGLSWIILTIISLIVIVSFVLDWNRLFAPAGLSLILESILLIVGKVKKSYQLKSYER